MGIKDSQMNIRNRILGRRVLLLSAAAAFAATTATAESTKIEYVSYGLDSEVARELWGEDYLDQAAIAPNSLPSVEVGTFEVDGETVRVTMIGSASVCGINTCPVRVFRGSERVAEFIACNNTDSHFVNASRSLFAACDDIFETGLAAPER